MKILIVIIPILLLLLGCEDGGEAIATGRRAEYAIDSSLIVPELYSGKFIESPGYGLTWTSSAEGSQYELEESGISDFKWSVVIYNGYNREFTVLNNMNYYRVRAIRSGFASQWSNTVKP